MTIPLAIFIGGGLGALTRWGVGRLLPAGTLPWSTLVVNVAGCFVLGLLVPIFAARTGGSPALQAGLTTGLLGGLTTFSTFGVQTVQAWQAAPHLGLANLALNVGVGIVAAALGMWLGSMMVGGRLA